MATKKPAFDFVVKQLEKDPTVAYADVAAAAERRGMQIYPIMYGRAKRLLGLVKGKSGKKKSAKTGPRKSTTRKKSTARKVTRKKRGRPAGRKTSTAARSGDVAGLEGVIEAMRTNEADRERYQATLLKIREMIDNVL